MAEKNKRFIKIYSQGGGLAAPSMEILVDRETGVNYVYASHGYGGGLTVLLNPDGTPVVTPVSEKTES